MAGDIHVTSEVFIVHGAKVLLRMHPNLKIWCSVGGHVDADEDPNHAAVREVKEEVGLDVRLWDGNKRFHTNDPHLRNLVPPVGMNRHTSYDGHEHVTLVFFATSETDTVVPEHENDEWRWVGKDELGGMDLLPNIREYAEGALKELAS